MSLNFDFGVWDLALMLAVSAQATWLAYVHSPRMKAILYSLPVPFTLASLSLGQPIDVTHVMGLPLVFLYTNGVRWLHVNRRVPIVVSILAGALAHCGIGMVLARWVPVTETSFWAAMAVVVVVSIGLYATMPHRAEPGHRSPLPIPVKFSLILVIISGLIVIKHLLRGFMASFPMVGLVAAYEARNCLWTLGRQVPALMLGMCPMLGICHVVQQWWGLKVGLAVGWVVFLLVLAGLSRRLWTVEAVDGGDLEGGRAV